MKVKSLLTICFVVVSYLANAQQMPLNNQYLINKFSLNPAYAGHNQNFESFISYRKSWLGIDGAPESKMMNINGTLAENMGIGGTIGSDQYGIFRNFSASLSYAYHLKLAAVHSLSFGVSAGILENHIDLTEINGNLADPVVMSNQDVRAALFDATFGILYRYQKINFGIVIPRLLESKTKDENNEILYTLSRHYNVHLSYLYDINKDWQVEPFVIIRKSANSDLIYEIAPLVKYKQQIWFAPTYRKGSDIAINIGGVPYNRFVANYTYEFSSRGMLGSSSGTHEISIGYLIGEGKGDIPPPNSKKPYYEWLD